MNEVKHIHLGRQQFTVSAAAYSELKSYLDDITKQVGETGKDVAEEVELRMAELLTQRGCSEDKVVLPSDVAFLKTQLGEPGDFGDEDEPAVKTSKPGEETTKRLFRDTDNAMIAGVASGLAKYLGIDPIIIRIIFVALTFTAGSGVLIYILLWLLVPEAKSSSDRLSMQGKAATVDNLKELVKRADIDGATQRAHNAVMPVLRTIGRVLLLVIGLPIVIGMSLAIIGSLTVALYYLIGGAKVSGQVIAPIGSHEVTAFVAGVVTLLTVLFSMLLVGVAMLRRRWQLPAWGVAALVGTFFVAASVGGAFAADVVPTVRSRVLALHHTQTVQEPAFTSAIVNGKNADINYTLDTRTYVQYKYWGNLDTAKLKTSVENGVLHVDTDGVGNTPDCNLFCINNGQNIEVTIHGPQPVSFTINGQNQNAFPTPPVAIPGEVKPN